MIGDFKNWAGTVAAILGGGPSLTPYQIDACNLAGVKVVAINNAIELAPAADLLYFCDEQWFNWHKDAVSVYANAGGNVVTLGNEKLKDQIPNLVCMKNTGKTGICREKTGLRTGQNSGYQALNLMLHLGVKRALLLGFDMQPVNGKSHWHKEHPVPTEKAVYPKFLKNYRAAAAEFAAAGLEIINCTPGSALDCFKFSKLEEALA